jgi:hypothetical protein
MKIVRADITRFLPDLFWLRALLLEVEKVESPLRAKNRSNKGCLQCNRFPDQGIFSVQDDPVHLAQSFSEVSPYRWLIPMVSFVAHIVYKICNATKSLATSREDC